MSNIDSLDQPRTAAQISKYTLRLQDAVREAKYQEQWARHNIKVMGTCAFFCAVMWVLQSKNADPRDKKCVFPVINSIMLGAIFIVISAICVQQRWKWLSGYITSWLMCSCMTIFLAAPYVFYFAATCHPDRLAIIIPYAKITGPAELGITYLSLVSTQTDFCHKLISSIVYVFVFRLGIRSALCPKLFLAGDWQGFVQLLIGVVVTLLALYKRELRSKICYVGGSEHLSSRDSLFGSHNRASKPLQERLHGFCRFLLQHYVAENAPKEAGFRRYYSKVSLKEQRRTYATAIISALVGAGSLVIRHSINGVFGWTVIGLGLVIPAACLLAMGFTFVSFLAAAHPSRQQWTGAISYCVIQSISLALVLRAVSLLPDSLNGVRSGAEFEAYLATIAFHVNFTIARSSSDSVRGLYALLCALVDLATAFIIFFKTKPYLGFTLTIMYGALAVIVGLVVSPLGEKSQRRYYRLVHFDKEQQKSKSSGRDPEKLSTELENSESQPTVDENLSKQMLPKQRKAQMAHQHLGSLIRTAVMDEGPSTPTTEAEITLQPLRRSSHKAG